MGRDYSYLLSLSIEESRACVNESEALGINSCIDHAPLMLPPNGTELLYRFHERTGVKATLRPPPTPVYFPPSSPFLSIPSPPTPCMCACACVCVSYVYRCAQACGGQRKTLGVFLCRLPPSCFFATRSLTHLEVCCFMEVVWPVSYGDWPVSALSAWVSGTQSNAWLLCRF